MTRLLNIDLLPLANWVLGPALGVERTGSRAPIRGDDGDDIDCRPGSICWEIDENGNSHGPVTGSKTGAEWALLAIVTTGLTGLVIYELLKQALEISWNNFGRPMPGNDADLITLADTSGTPEGEMIITLTIDPSIKWWKAVEVYTADGRLIGSAWCKRDEGVVENTIQVFQYQNPSYIVFKKAKTLGAHTSMYVLRELGSRTGHRLQFTWVAQD